VTTLTETKHATKRLVPLSSGAVKLLELLPRPEEGHTVFGIIVKSLDALFRKIKNRAMIEDAMFHDSRYLAIIRLAKKLNLLDLVRIVGIKIYGNYRSITTKRPTQYTSGLIDEAR
jgi:hypothetical protein